MDGYGVGYLNSSGDEGKDRRGRDRHGAPRRGGGERSDVMEVAVDLFRTAAALMPNCLQGGQHSKEVRRPGRLRDRPEGEADAEDSMGSPNLKRRRCYVEEVHL